MRGATSFSLKFSKLELFTILFVLLSFVSYVSAEDAPKEPAAGAKAVDSGLAKEAASVDDVLNKEAPDGKIPTAKDIDAAYQGCLKYAEQDAKELDDASDDEKQKFLEGEKKACDEAKVKCLKDAKTIFCVAFVEDHLSD